MHLRSVVFLLLFALGVFPGQTFAQDLTQRQWMTGLVESMGWSFGLPDDPELADYLRILEGRRSLRIEAEEYKQPTDLVSVKRYGNFGPFSGEGWVSGVAAPTTLHLRFLLPLSGTYRVSAAVRLPGHRVKVGGQSFEIDGGRELTETMIGDVKLSAGMQEIAVQLPPNGAIDFIELHAPAYVPVEPRGGWQPDAPLHLDDMAVTAVQAMGILAQLPPTGRQIRVEAESASRISGVDLTSTRYLGPPSSGRWLRAGTGAGRVILPFDINVTGAYRLQLVAVGEQELEFELDGRYRRVLQAGPYLSAIAAGAFPLEAGEHQVQVGLEPRSGIDLMILHELSNDSESYRQLAGLSGVDDSPTPELIDRTLELLAAIGSLR